ncbi:MAG: hypothetical protein RL345_327, partial [Chloroflexota bacterium]
WDPVPCVIQTGPASTVRARVLVGATVRIGRKNGRRTARITMRAREALVWQPTLV